VVDNRVLEPYGLLSGTLVDKTDRLSDRQVTGWPAERRGRLWMYSDGCFW